MLCKTIFWLCDGKKCSVHDTALKEGETVFYSLFFTIENKPQKNNQTNKTHKKTPNIENKESEAMELIYRKYTFTGPP